MSSIDYKYKGKYTSLNGLTNWMGEYDRKIGIQHKMRVRDIYDDYLNIIVRYALENIVGFKKKGHTSIMADRIAVKIQTNNKFNLFKEWYMKYRDEIKP